MNNGPTRNGGLIFCRTEQMGVVASPFFVATPNLRLEQGRPISLLPHHPPTPTSQTPSDAKLDPLSDFLPQSDPREPPRNDRTAVDLKSSQIFWGKIIILFYSFAANSLCSASQFLWLKLGGHLFSLVFLLTRGRGGLTV